MRISRLIAVLALLCTSAALAQPANDPYFTKYPTNDPQGTRADYARDQGGGAEPYQAVQIWDGFGAFFVAVGEPILIRPSVRIKQCVKNSSGGAAAAAVPFCGLYGVVEGAFFSIRDVLTGTGDVITGGYFRLSRQAGVFDNL
jgi:hypothetical protein